MTGHYSTEHVPGGAAQNTARVAQWVLSNHCTSMLGSVGCDTYSDKLRSEMVSAHVQTLYQEFPQQSTGICAAMVTRAERTLVTSLGASGALTLEFVVEQWERISAYDIFYFEGYVLNSSPSIVQKIIHYSHA